MATGAHESEREHGIGERADAPRAEGDTRPWQPRLSVPGLILLALAFAFGPLTQLVDPKTSGDYQILHFLGTHRIDPLTKAALVLDKVGGPTVTPWLTVAIVLLLIVFRRAVLGLLVGAITFLSWLPGFFAKKMFTRPRPPRDVNPVFDYSGPGANSFPSGHTSFGIALVVALAFALHVRGHRGRWPLVVGGLLVACIMFARMYLGLHWPTDVVAGLFFGLGTAMLLWPVCAWLYDRARAKWPHWA